MTLRISPNQWLFAAITVVVLALGSWAWFHYMEKRWVALPNFSFEAIRNPMLAAERLLNRFDYQANADASLQTLLRQPLPDGSLLLANSGLMTGEQTDQLLAWVAAGNTLILQPQLIRFDEEEAGDDAPYDELINPDPIGDYFGVARQYRPTKTEDEEDAAGDAAAEAVDEIFADAEAIFDDGAEASDVESSELETSELKTSALESSELEPSNTEPSNTEPSNTEPSKTETAEPATPAASDGAAADADSAEDKIRFDTMLWPDRGYALQLRQSHTTLVDSAEAPAADLADAAQAAVRIYREGEGQVVFLATNYFDNDSLGEGDHAELLLALVSLNPLGKQVRIVTDIDMPVWYVALWQQFRWALLGVALLLLLWLWQAMRRFGPMVPEPDVLRRAQLEHIDASARWLWRLPGGRERLLNAVRSELDGLLQRQHPALRKLDERARCAKLAELTGLSADDVFYALQAPAARLPVAFTRQLQLLQTLRRHHERP